MRLSFRFVPYFFLLSITLFLHPAAYASNILANGGFETGDLTGWAQSGDTSCTSVVAAGTDLTSTPCGFNAAYAATTHSGNYALYAGPSEFGYITATLATIPGGEYTLDFWLASIENPGFGHLPNGFSVIWNGVTIQNDSDLGVFDYTHYTYSGLLATGATTNISIGTANIHSYFAIDDVSVAPDVPEPASGILLGSALVGLAALSRLRRR